MRVFAIVVGLSLLLLFSVGGVAINVLYSLVEPAAGMVGACVCGAGAGLAAISLWLTVRD